MNFPNYFSDAEASFNEGDYVIFGVPYDKTGSFRRGTKKAPYSIRQASWNFESYDLLTEVDLKNLNIHDYGDLDINNDESSVMRQKVEEFVLRILDNKKIPISIGGEHTITVPIINAYKKKNKNIGVIVFDAHLDFKDTYENNPHSHACVVRRISDIIGVDNVVVLGVRSGTKDEFEEGQKSGLLHLNSFDIKRNGIEWALNQVSKKFKDKDIYITLDIDSIDPSFAPGTSTPEPFGLEPFDILSCIKKFSSKLIGSDIVEVCPPYDKGETAILAARILRYIIAEISLNKT